MHHPTDRIAHTTAFVTPLMEHWLEREINQWVHPLKDRSDDPSPHERTLLPRSYILLPEYIIHRVHNKNIKIIFNIHKNFQQYFLFLAQHNESSCVPCTPGYHCASTGMSSPTSPCDPGWFCTLKAYLSQPSAPEGGKCLSGELHYKCFIH